MNSRQLTLTGYGDNFTEKTLATRNEKTLAIIKPDAVGKVGPILERVCREGLSGFDIAWNLRTFWYLLFMNYHVIVRVHRREFCYGIIPLESVNHIL